MTHKRVRRMNAGPESEWRKPAEAVTDRALRYRAQTLMVEEPGLRRCLWCGSPDVEVAHIDGDETHTVRENLAWTCRPCNQRVAANMKRAGVGRRTKQFNAGRKRKGASDYREFARALGILDGTAIGNMDDAIALIHATPKSKRSEFQKDIWTIRKERYGESGRKDGGALPF